MAGPRHRAREIALQVLVQMDVSPELDAGRALAIYFEHFGARSAADGDDDGDGDGEADVGADQAFDRAMVDELVRGVAARRAELDEIVQAQSKNWRIERMALVERNVIRLALYELKFVTTVPTNVALDEAIELCKHFGSAEGAAFVNGILDRAVNELELRR
jgi:N utilization substance protein B